MDFTNIQQKISQLKTVALGVSDIANGKGPTKNAAAAQNYYKKLDQQKLQDLISGAKKDDKTDWNKVDKTLDNEIQKAQTELKKVQDAVKKADQVKAEDEKKGSEINYAG